MNRKSFIKSSVAAIGAMGVGMAYGKGAAGLAPVITGEDGNNNRQSQSVPLVKMNDGWQIPMVGLGVYSLPKDVTVKAVKTAVELGYRLVDTAQVYGNEAEVLEGIRQSGIPREEIFITTKVSPRNMNNRTVKESLEESWRKLGSRYIDLVIIHFPVKKEGDIEAAWKEMERFAESGKTRSIGISTFQEHHIDDLLKYARIKPALNQIEIHPYFTQQENVGYNLVKDITVQGWSPFGSGKNGVLQDPVIAEVAKRYNKSVAQVILRWNIQRGILVIPRSTNPGHMKENQEIFDFELSPVDMSIINGLNRNEVWEPLGDPDVRPWE